MLGGGGGLQGGLYHPGKAMGATKSSVRLAVATPGGSDKHRKCSGTGNSLGE